MLSFGKDYLNHNVIVDVHCSLTMVQVMQSTS